MCDVERCPSRQNVEPTGMIVHVAKLADEEANDKDEYNDNGTLELKP